MNIVFIVMNNIHKLGVYMRWIWYSEKRKRKKCIYGLCDKM